MASALFSPLVLERAWSWRFALVGSTASPSTRVSHPTPPLARASAAKVPTPPSPSTTTWEAKSVSMAAIPSRRAVRSSSGGSGARGTF